MLYLHIPFCDSKCHYCAFNSYVDQDDLQVKYMDAILKQLDEDIKKFAIKNSSIESVFIGGGTPSTVKPKLYEAFFEKLKPYLKDDVEITTEANPQSATKEWLSGMKKLGVNRVSFGVQSFDDKKLKYLGRAHNKNDAINAVKNAKKLGFENISIDVIYGTSIDTKGLIQEDLKIAFSLPINHLSAYALTIEEGTPFEKAPHLANEELNITEYIFDEIKKHGFNQYEISNFGSYRCRHNIGYWKQKNYLGIGAGAVGFKDSERYYPLSDIKSYIENPLHKEVEKLSSEDLKSEAILLGLRSDTGVDVSLLDENGKKRLEILIEEDKVFLKDNKFFNHNFLLSDEIALYLLK